MSLAFADPLHGVTVPRLHLSSVEIFSGAGGLALGMEQAGFRHLALVELDKHACATLRENSVRKAVNGHGWPVVEGAVAKFEYGPYIGRASILAGGAPCQPFSLAGRQQGDADRRNMFPEVFRALRELMPQAFLLENVRNLAGRGFRPYFDYLLLQLEFPFEEPRAGETWAEHKRRLEELRVERRNLDPTDRPTYEVRAGVLNAADFGVPQIRHRVFIVGFRRDQRITPRIPVGFHSEDALLWSQWVDRSYWDENRVAISQIPEMPCSVAARVARLRAHGKPPELRWRTLRDAINHEPEAWAWRPLPEPVRAGTDEYQQHFLIPGARVYEGHTGNDLDRPAKTIKAGDHGNPGGEHVLVRMGHPHRYLSIRECARVQSFPDSYHFVGSRSECMRQLGNAVPVLLARILAESVAQQVLSANASHQNLVAAGA
ncbi:MAG: DNA cytosine methyltransferase [Chloroflexi bacterium]|nr:DNA cytosine methyltransferase [Chloroflexota bacterium]